MEWLQTADWAVLDGIQALRCGFLDFLMPRLTFLGEAGMVWLVAAAVLLLTKKYRRYGVLLLAGLLAGLLLGNVVLKNLVARPRPCWLRPDFPLLIANPADFSFPSGHTLSSTIAATVLTNANRRFGLWAIPLAALLAFSRLYLYVHFPSDILAGAALGAVIGFLTVHFGRKWAKPTP